MKSKILVLSALATLLTSCDMVRSVNASTCAIHRNREVVEMSTAAICRNVQAIKAANQAVIENRRNLEAMQESQSDE